jgi:8-oxo-dGTP pyrophosphatase MutT (NUDIX family)
MREMVIALSLIEQDDNFLLQLRGENPMIGGAGLIGCFGGKLEHGESALAAVCREVAEETTHRPTEEDFTVVGSVEVVSDHKLETVKVYGHVFRLLLGNDVALTAKEGELVALPKNEIPKYLDKMTTGTRACFEQFILGET